MNYGIQKLAKSIKHAILQAVKPKKLSKIHSKVLDGLFERAREQGITQQELARRAGIHPVSLSQAKARGDLRLSTLEALAAVVGLEVALVPSQARERVREAIREGTLFQVVTD